MFTVHERDARLIDRAVNMLSPDTSCCSDTVRAHTCGNDWCRTHDHQPRPLYAREAHTLSISVVPPVLHWQWLLHRINWQPPASMYVYSLRSLSRLLWWAKDIGIRYHDNLSWRVQPYGTSWRLGSEQLGSSTAIRTDILSRAPESIYISLPTRVRAISPIQSIPHVSCTVDSRYHKYSMIVILLSNHQRDEF